MFRRGSGVSALRIVLKNVAGVAGAVALGFSVSMFASGNPQDAILLTGLAVQAKFVKASESCPWKRVLSFGMDSVRRKALTIEYSRLLKPVLSLPQLGIQKVNAPNRSYWIPARSADLDRLTRELAEEDRLEQIGVSHHIRPGEIVLDLGAGLGVFVSKALARGAAQVIAVETDPTSLECLHRSFDQEISDGRVVLARNHSGEGADFIHLSSTWTRGLPETLEDHPRLLMERRDQTPPPGYEASCGPCEWLSGHAGLVPTALFYY